MFGCNQYSVFCFSDIIFMDTSDTSEEAGSTNVEFIISHQDESNRELQLQQHVDQFKTWLKKILEDSLDEFELLELSSKLGCELPTEYSYAVLKYEVRRFILLQLIKADTGDGPYYQRLLREAEEQCGNRKSEPYLCCFAGCLFSTDKHRKYILHLKFVHVNHKNLLCNFKKKCLRRFNSFDQLHEHVNEIHLLVEKNQKFNSSVDIDLECRCNLISCGGMKFKSVSLLVKHFNTFHVKDSRACIFKGCNLKFDKGVASRHHIRSKHILPCKVLLKPEHILDQLQQVMEAPVGYRVTELNSVEEIDQDFCDNSEDLNLEYDSFDSKEDEKYFKMQYADFLNRMSNYSYIPSVKVSEIANDFLQNSLKSQELRKNTLMKILDSIQGLSQSDRERILDVSISDDSYLNAQNELGSEFKRTKFIQENFDYVSPVQVVLN